MNIQIAIICTGDQDADSGHCALPHLLGFPTDPGHNHQSVRAWMVLARDVCHPSGHQPATLHPLVLQSFHLLAHVQELPSLHAATLAQNQPALLPHQDVVETLLHPHTGPVSCSISVPGVQSAPTQQSDRQTYYNQWCVPQSTRPANGNFNQSTISQLSTPSSQWNDSMRWLYVSFYCLIHLCTHSQYLSDKL